MSNELMVVAKDEPLPLVTNGDIEEMFEVANTMLGDLESMVKVLVLAGEDLLSDEQVESLIGSSAGIEVRACILRGACYSVLRHRDERRQMDGRSGGVGLKKLMTDVAHRTGVAVSTAYQDLKIFERHVLDPNDMLDAEPDEFLQSLSNRLSVIQNHPSLSRLHLVLTSSALDPDEALDTALEEAERSKNFTPQHLRELLDQKELSVAKRKPAEGAAAKNSAVVMSITGGYTLKEVELSIDAKRALRQALVKANEVDPSVIISRALVYYWKEDLSKDRTAAANAVR
jgi:hypothetical protein